MRGWLNSICLLFNLISQLRCVYTALPMMAVSRLGHDILHLTVGDWASNWRVDYQLPVILSFNLSSRAFPSDITSPLFQLGMWKRLTASNLVGGIATSGVKIDSFHIPTSNFPFHPPPPSPSVGCSLQRGSFLTITGLCWMNGSWKHWKNWIPFWILDKWVVYLGQYEMPRDCYQGKNIIHGWIVRRAIFTLFRK